MSANVISYCTSHENVSKWYLMWIMKRAFIGGALEQDCQVTDFSAKFIKFGQKVLFGHWKWAEHLAEYWSVFFHCQIPSDSVFFVWSAAIQDVIRKTYLQRTTKLIMLWLVISLQSAMVWLREYSPTVTSMKTLTRNHLHTDMLDAVNQTGLYIQFQAKCCKDLLQLCTC